MLQHIVNEPAPRLNGHGGGGFPKEAEEFVDDCLRKEIGERKSPKELLVRFNAISFFIVTGGG